MSSEWEDLENITMISGANSAFGVHEGYEYKVMRRKKLTDRESFVADCDWKMRVIYPDVATDVYGVLYDLGARFK